MDNSKIKKIITDSKMLKYILIALVLAVSLIIYLSIRSGGAEGDLIEIRQDGSSVSAEMSAEGEDSDSEQSKEGKKVNNDQPEYIYVDVSGAVNAPMVVCIPSGSRVFQAIEAAGGRKEESSVKTLNLAEVCEDGQKIYVPTEEEVKEAEESGSSVPEGDGKTAGTESSGEQSSSGKTESGSGKVNINTAGSEELQTLTGVGPAIASRIIDYRNTNGAFQSVEEITNVSGIGEKTYEKFKDQICI